MLSRVGRTVSLCSLVILGACHATVLEPKMPAYDGVTRCGPIDPSRSPASPDVRPQREPVASIAPMRDDRRSDLSRNTVDRTMRGARGLLLGCYQRLLNRDPGAGGKVTAVFRIRANGATANLELHGFDPTLDACLCERLASLRFDADEPTEVRYPLTFDTGR